MSGAVSGEATAPLRPPVERVLMVERTWTLDPESLAAVRPDESADPVHIVVFDDPVGANASVLPDEAANFRVTHIRSGPQFRKNRAGNGELQFNPDHPEHLEYVFEELTLAESPPEVIVFGPEFGRNVSIFRKSPDPELLLRQRLEMLRTMMRAVHRYNLPVSRLIFFLRKSEELQFLALAAISGFARTAAREGLKPHVLTVVLDGESAQTPEELAAIVENETRITKPEFKVRYRRGRRYVQRFSLVEEFSANAPARPVPLLKSRGGNKRGKGAVLITGGMGGLGRIFARYLASEIRADLLLVGRARDLSAEGRDQLADLRDRGVRVEYLPADVSDPRAVKQILSFAKKSFGGLRGVLHCAGALSDSLVLTPENDDFTHILGPKVTGTIHLDRLLGKEPLDFFVLFSSISAVLGNPGQSTYAAANRLMDLFADWREERRRAGKRFGRTLSINWPLWSEGGMQIPEEQLETLFAQTGMTPLSTRAGLRAFERALNSGRRQLAVVSGDTQRLREVLFNDLIDERPGARKNDPGGTANSRPSDPNARATPAVSADAGDADDIAIIGLSGRYPAAENLEQFWDNLRSARDSVSEVPAERWDPRQYGAMEHPVSFWGGFISDVDKFDALYFSIPPTTAPFVDPQERLFLETAAAAVQDAGYRRRDLEQSRVGVFAGVMWNDYRLLGFSMSDPRRPASTASTFSSIANRVSYFLNLNGPSLAVDTACSSSLTALHLACQSIKAGECEMAIAGGVNLLLHPDKYVLLSQLHMTASDGRCRSFGAGGDGYVPGEGVGAVVLKPKRRAIADGDAIYGVIKGSAVNHGGRTGGYTVPHSGAQGAVIATALASARVAPESIDYVEAHGTGTSLGDPIELQGLEKAFTGLRSSSIALGSVKSNIGHLESAAGIAALTKTLLQLKYAELAPSLHSADPNPTLDFTRSPFYLQHNRAPWIRGETNRPRRAGISSFGAGGSNAHVVIEDFFDARPTSPDGEAELFLFSARSPEALRDVASAMVAWLEKARQAEETKSAEQARGADSAQTAKVNLNDLAFTLSQGREEFEYRLAIVARNPAGLCSALEQALLQNQAAGDRIARGRAKRDQAKAVAPGGSRESVLFELGRQWVGGASLEDCERELRAGRPAKRVAGLPAYPFERRSYWFGGEFGPVRLERADRDAPAAETTILSRFAPKFAARLNAETDLAAGQSEIEAYGAALLGETLQAMGLAPAFEGQSPADLRRRLGIVDRHEKLFDAFLDILRRAGRIEVDATGSLRSPSESGPEGGRPARELRNELLKAHPEFAALVHLIDTCVGGYAEILRGTVAATDVMFPDASMDLVAPIYRDNRIYAFFNQAAADFVTELAADLFAANLSENRRPVRILEIGAGTGGTSAAILEGLAAFQPASDSGNIQDRLTYYYTDISAGFTGYGRRNYGAAYPFAQFKPLDIEKDVEAQGFEAHSIDVVIAANALHATGDIGSVLQRVYRLLKPGGALVLNEALRGADWLTLTFGLLDGWWLYTDADLRIPHSPLLDAAAWRAALSAGGFAATDVYSGSSGRSAEVGQGLVVALRDGGIAPALRPVAAFQDLQAETKIAEPTAQEDLHEMELFIRARFAQELGVTAADIDVDARFSDYGVDSILAVRIIKQINESLGTNMKPTVLFDYSSVRELAGYVQTIAKPQLEKTRPPVTEVVRGARPESRASLKDEAIAVIGMAGRFPGAADYEQFWENIKAGRDSVTEVPPDRWDVDRYYDSRPQTPDRTYSRQGGYVADVDEFDPLFFGITPAEAEFIDPQQRLFLQEAWKAFEDAGYNPHDFARSRCGVFVGAPPSDYQVLMQDAGLSVNPYVFAGNSSAILAARISYFLNLTGPSIAFDTACSSTLVAFHQACLSLVSGECDTALAGGVSIFTSPQYHVLASSLGMLSPRGKCSTFDGAADGFVIGEGVGAFLLKPLRAATRDGDHIHGVIRGIALNQDGKTNGITAPSSTSQRELQLEVFRNYAIHPESIGYVEAHGTGTKLGDPIEIEALSAAFGEYTRRKQFCPIGSVKTNVGHSSLAAGAAQIMKVLLAFKNRAIPPSLNFNQANPLIDFSDSPFYVNTELRAWETVPGTPRRASVSSFGFSGTNSFLVLEEYQAKPATAPAFADPSSASPVFVPLSAQSPEQLLEYARALGRRLATISETIPETSPEANLANIAATLQAGRTAFFEERVVFIARSKAELREQLAAFDRAGVVVDGRNGAHSTQSETVFRGSADPDGTHEQIAAAEVATAFAAGADPRPDFLRELAARWVGGAVIPWKQIYAAGQGTVPVFQRVPLPTYPFARIRCWLPLSPEGSEQASRSPGSVASDGAAKTVQDDPLTTATHAAADILQVAAATLSANIPLSEFGMDAVQSAQLRTRLGEELNIDAGALNDPRTRTLADIAAQLRERIPAPVAAPEATAPAAAIEFAAPPASIAAAGVPDPAGNQSGLDGGSRELVRIAEAYLISEMAREFKIPGSRIRPKAPLQNYGIDSVLITKFNATLGRVFGELPKTLFFQYQTVRELAGYFADLHGDRLREVTGAPGETPSVSRHDAQTPPAATITVKGAPEEPGPEAINIESENEMRNQDNRDVAIIGMAGKFPRADNVDEFWNNLKSGVDCISEIPPERWEHAHFFDPDKDAEGDKSYSKWGGFIRDVDAFDPTFFNITPRDAELMDPQQRLFLTASWAAIEDAGYTRQRLSETARLRGKKDVGVYAGINYAEYQFFMNVPISGFWSVANRVSYHLDFNGPSMAIDTACSSSLTALHVAYESVRRGECAYALAGGVNVSIHPGKYVLMSAGRFASSDGRCRSFGAGGDGYVAGEGVVSLLLKPLAEARADGDRVYGVIKGSAVNHGGKTNGFTVPNPTAQAALAYEVLQDTGIDPRSISYVEAHGTGTPLGDPIEIAGLSQAWGRFTQDRQFCPIGSAKSSVGHLEGAAGAAGLVKLLLQMRHRQLPPSLHSENLNPNIDFTQTPFVVQRGLADWPRPVLERDGGRVEVPRRATVSSFGAGGANAHMIVEEADSEAVAPEANVEGGARESRTSNSAELIVLSARKPERLREYSENLRDFLIADANKTNFADLAYTLLMGREAFECRLAIFATSSAELSEKLNSYLAGQGAAGVFAGEISANRMYDDMPGREDTDREYLRTLYRSGQLNRLAGFWIDGWDIDWQDLYAGQRRKIVSAPTYPFAKERYWLGTDEPFIAVTPDGRPLRTILDDHSKSAIPKKVLEQAVASAAAITTSSETPAPIKNEARAAAAPDNNGTNGNGSHAKNPGATANGGAPTPPAAPGASNLGDVTERLREEIKSIFGVLAKIEPQDLDIDANFMQIGFDSVASVRMMNRLMKKFNVRIPATAMHEYPTIVTFAKYLVESGIITPEILEAGKGDGVKPGTVQGQGAGPAAALLTPKIEALELPHTLKTDRIFLTGATGVLAGKILCDLLRNSQSKIYCLVRADDAEHANQRIWSVLAVYDPERSLQSEFDRRVIPVLGDVTQEYFGQTPADYDRLAAEIDFTIHAAGKTLLVTFYDVLAPINVEGTQRIIDFCLRTEQKYLAYISSFSVMGDRLNFNNPPFTEHDLEMGQDYDHLPYQETKYHAEKLVRAATDQGLVWNIFRPGNIMGDGRHGHYPLAEVNVKGAYYDIFKTFIETGTSLMTPIYFDITPVDYVSEGLLYLSMKRPVYRQTFHLTNPDIRRSFEVFRYLENFGYQMEMLTLDEYLQSALSGGSRRIGTNEAYESQALEMVKYGIEIFGKIHYEESSYADCTWTRSILEPAGVDCPNIKELVNVYLKYCIEHGYIPSPEAQIPATSTASIG
ncbi:MAG: SDR family NAD(P)-dependent oxidoreductase [Leptospirales bacterium]